MDNVAATAWEKVTVNSLEAALISALNAKEEYLKVQDFDNAAKWRDIADSIKKSILMSERPVK